MEINNKRKADSSPEAFSSSTKNKTSSSTTSNQASISTVVLPKKSHEENKSAPFKKNKLATPFPPPPIKIVGIEEYGKIKEIMKNYATNFKIASSIASLSNNVWKINMLDIDSYRRLSEELNTKGYQWFSYENKNERPIKVMVRGLHNIPALRKK